MVRLHIYVFCAVLALVSTVAAALSAVIVATYVQLQASADDVPATGPLVFGVPLNKLAEYNALGAQFVAPYVLIQDVEVARLVFMSIQVGLVLLVLDCLVFVPALFWPLLLLLVAYAACAVVSQMAAAALTPVGALVTAYGTDPLALPGGSLQALEFAVVWPVALNVALLLMAGAIAATAFFRPAYLRARLRLFYC